MSNQFIRKAKELAEKTHDKIFFKYHIKPVVKHALKLAEIKGGDKEIVEIAAWLHDIGWKESSKLGRLNKHHVDSARIAENFLRKLGYPEEKTKKVVECILCHRGAIREFKPKSLESRILRNATAMAHLETFLDLFAWNAEKRGLENAIDYIYEKLKRDWKRKVTFPEAKRMVKKYYEAAKILINSMKKIRQQIS